MRPTTIAFLFLALCACLSTPIPVCAQKKMPLLTNERVKIFPLEKKLSTSEAEVNEWLKESRAKVISIRLIPAPDANSALVIHYERTGLDDRTVKLKLFEQDETLTNYEKKVNRWLDAEKAIILGRDTCIGLNKGESHLQSAYIYAKDK